MLDGIIGLAVGTAAIVFRRPWARLQVAIWNRYDWQSWIKFSDSSTRKMLVGIGVFFIAVGVCSFVTV